MHTYPNVRRALAGLLALVAILLGLFIMIFPNRIAPTFILGVTDVMLGVAIVLGIVIVRSQYDHHE